MRLDPLPGSVVMRGEPQWLRCAFTRADLVGDVVRLARVKTAPAAGDTPCDAAFAGLAVDRHCRIFHPVADSARIEYLLWGRQTALRVVADEPQEYDLHGMQDAAGQEGGLPKRPVALACDDAAYLYIADADPAAPALWLVDIWQHDVARHEALPAIPIDLVHRAGVVYVLLEGGKVARLEACAPLEISALQPDLAAARRIDAVVDAGHAVRRFVLVEPGHAGARVQCVEDDAISFKVPFCTDFVIAPEEDEDHGRVFVFARRPGEDFVRYRLVGSDRREIDALSAPQYAGDGITWAPDGRVAYWTARGVRHAAPARQRYEGEGFVHGYALDGHHDHLEWGRVVLEACIPAGTRVRLRCYTRDDLEYDDPIARTKPANEDELAAIASPELTPLPSASWDATAPEWQPLFRDGARGPLDTPLAHGFVRYDAPVMAPPGRFVWIELELTGSGTKTPQVRSLRIEWPRHGLLRQLPKTLWRDPRAADFLARYLMPPAAMLEQWAEVADGRQRLLDPRIAPREALEWLGGWLGLAMDPCWPEAARRRMLREAIALFRVRGTVDGLKRMIEILAGGEATIVELFRLRSGTVAGNAQSRISRSVLGTGYRVGGPIGVTGDTALEAGEERPFEDYAHRFTVMVAARLDEEQMACLRRLIETHKPAHTMFELCAVHSGTRVGVGLHVGLGAAIGKGSGFDPLVLSDAVLGKGYLLGRAPLEPSPGKGRWS